MRVLLVLSGRLLLLISQSCLFFSDVLFSTKILIYYIHIYEVSLEREQTAEGKDRAFQYCFTY